MMSAYTAFSICLLVFCQSEKFACSFISLYYRAFDAELLYIAQTLKIPVSEVAVNWTEIEGN